MSSRSLSCWRQRSRWYELGETICERHGEQEGEEHLDTRERHAKLVEQLDQFSVVTVLLVLVRHGHLFQPGLPLETRVLLDGAEDALQDPGSRDDHLTRPVAKLVDPLTLTASRVDIDD